MNTVVVAIGDRIEPAEGASVCPVCPFLLAVCGLLIASEGVLFWGELCCSRGAQDGEKAEEGEEEEGERGRSEGEAGAAVGFSFSIMAVNSRGESPSVPSS